MFPTNAVALKTYNNAFKNVGGPFKLQPIDLGNIVTNRGEIER